MVRLATVCPDCDKFVGKKIQIAVRANQYGSALNAEPSIRTERGIRKSRTKLHTKESEALRESLQCICSIPESK